jgi:hypothetical protein
VSCSYLELSQDLGHQASIFSRDAWLCLPLNTKEGLNSLWTSIAQRSMGIVTSCLNASSRQLLTAASDGDAETVRQVEVAELRAAFSMDSTCCLRRALLATSACVHCMP